MTRHEIVGLALDQLLESFAVSPESFEYNDKDYIPSRLCGSPTILWQPTIELKDDSNSSIPDPNNSQRAMIVTYNAGELKCYIFSKQLGEFSHYHAVLADAVIASKQSFMYLRSNYRKFMHLRRLIKAKDKAKEDERFFKKLCSVFPGALDKHIFG